MNYTDILTLAKAGFTAEQIRILSIAESAGAAQQQPAPAAVTPTPEPVPAPAPAAMSAQIQTPAPVNNMDPAKVIYNNFFPAPTPAPTPATTPATAPATALTTASVPTSAPVQVAAPDPNQTQAASGTIDDVLKQLGIMQTTMQGQALAFAQQPKAQTAEDVIAEIINPPAPQKGDK